MSSAPGTQWPITSWHVGGKWDVSTWLPPARGVSSTPRHGSSERWMDLFLAMTDRCPSPSDLPRHVCVSPGVSGSPFLGPQSAHLYWGLALEELHRGATCSFTEDHPRPMTSWEWREWLRMTQRGAGLRLLSPWKQTGVGAWEPLHPDAAPAPAGPVAVLSLLG